MGWFWTGLVPFARDGLVFAAQKGACSNSMLLEHFIFGYDLTTISS